MLALRSLAGLVGGRGRFGANDWVMPGNAITRAIEAGRTFDLPFAIEERTEASAPAPVVRVRRTGQRGHAA